MDADRTADVRAALARHGFAPDGIEVLSRRTTGRRRHRQTLRVHLRDGSSIKVRCLESREAAVNLVEIRRQLAPRFAPVIAQDDAMLIETWIEGRQLPAPEAAERAAELGAIMGNLHATAMPEVGRRTGTRGRATRAIEQLAYLSSLGVVSDGLATALAAEVTDTDPGDAHQTIVHRDFCPENLVVDRDDAIHVIDNEWITIDAPGVDLGRTYSRWPLPAVAWESFLRGYRGAAPFDPGPLRFWLIVMAAAGAAIRIGDSPSTLAEPVARLRELAPTSCR